MRSRMSSDMGAEAQLAAFLDEHFYPWLSKRYGYDCITRVDELELQYKGIDVITYANGRISYVDEKAQLYYMQDPLPTFAFELSFLRAGEERLGWFINDELMTETYLLLFPRSDVDVSKVTKTDFKSVEAIALSKKKLREYLSDRGLDKETLRKKADAIRRSRKTGRIDRAFSGIDIRGIYLYASSPSRYIEAPINLVIGKDHLKRVANASFIITKDAAEEIKEKDDV